MFNTLTSLKITFCIVNSIPYTLSTLSSPKQIVRKVLVKDGIMFRNLISVLATEVTTEVVAVVSFFPLSPTSACPFSSVSFTLFSVVCISSNVDELVPS